MERFDEQDEVGDDFDGNEAWREVRRIHRRQRNSPRHVLFLSPGALARPPRLLKITQCVSIYLIIFPPESQFIAERVVTSSFSFKEHPISQPISVVNLSNSSTIV